MFGCRPGFVRVLEQVQQRLFELRGIEASGLFRQGTIQRETDLRAQAFAECRPYDRFQPRRGQLGEVRITANETFQMPRTFLDRAEDFLEALVLAAPHELDTRMRQRRDRRQRVVEFVADDADDFLPGLYFLPAQLGGQVAQQEQFVATAVEAEAATREMEDLFVVFHADREQAVAAAFDRLAQRLRRVLQQGFERMAFELVAVVEQLACGEVGIHDAAAAIGQQHCDRRVLHHRIEQQFALHQRHALLAQGIAQCVVRRDQIADFVVVRPRQSEIEIAVAIAGHGAAQRAEQRQHRRESAAHDVHGQRQQHDQRKNARKQRAVEPGLQCERQHDCNEQQDACRQRMAPGQRTATARRVHRRCVRALFMRARRPAVACGGTAPVG